MHSTPCDRGDFNIRSRDADEYMTPNRYIRTQNVHLSELHYHTVEEIWENCFVTTLRYAQFQDNPSKDGA